MDKKEYNFGEKEQEYSTKKNGLIDVWQTPKYKQSKEKAISLLHEHKFLSEGDFWVLMNETKSGKMAYTGLIISHNACLKLNDNQPQELQFKVESLSSRISDYSNELLYEYANAEQGLYEVGEVSKDNCKNNYPHAMAFKRLFDRVVLKLTKIAYDGIYSDGEADEFKEPIDKNKELEKKDGYACEVCGTITYGTSKRTAEELKQASIKRYNQPLCFDCAKGVEEYEVKIKKQRGEKNE